ncbi:hypothetical protein IKG12_02330 [Candidatus Saccharibacteria bacterium]|nr:hypothetical protein [Candidatus Saccharibacteria bacterium]
MSKKSTKIIAAAGVVAGLGVAALPAMTFATETVAGEVTLTANVEEAIAMTITGNGDPTSGEPAVQQPGVDVYSPTGATTIDGHPVGALYDPDNLQTSSSTLDILPNATNTNTATSQIKVYTNAASGFSLSVKDADNTTALVHSVDSNATIPAGATLTAGTAAWAYKGGSVSNWAAISATDAQVYTQSAPTSGGATINMEYGVATASDQKTGTYSDTIIYTATTN